jgi:periplasmic divalent cation tolerance protein
MKNQYIVIFVTVKNKTEAKKIALGLLKDKLVACVNIQDGIESYFWWQGRLDSSKEAMLIIKSKQKLFEKIASKVKVLHSYENPEIIALPIVAGSLPYLKWIDESVL